jgi:hypothetical protein
VSGADQCAWRHDGILAHSALPQLPLERQPSSLAVKTCSSRVKGGLIS